MPMSASCLPLGSLQRHIIRITDIFADQGFQDDCHLSNQVITFCGVGSHHQNGIAKCKIKELTLGAWTLLLHAKRMLPEYILAILWPFALKCAKDRLNNLVY
jgi:hypothetical protein